ncbi:MAG: hypothetical protein ABI439_08650 [Rhodospirillales bacterium]
MAQAANPATGVTMGRLLIVLGMVAIAFAVWAFVFGESVKPLGQMADGLPLWQLIGICSGVIGLADVTIGAFMVKQARRAMDATASGPKS